MSPRHTALAQMPARWKTRGPPQALRLAFAPDERKCSPQSPDKNLDGSKLVRQMRRIIGTAGIIIAMSGSFSPCLLFLRHMINIALSMRRVLRGAFLSRTGQPHALTQARDPGVGSPNRFADAGNSPAHLDGIIG
jgi:hypothetical protein